MLFSARLRVSRRVLTRKRVETSPDNFLNDLAPPVTEAYRQQQFLLAAALADDGRRIGLDAHTPFAVDAIPAIAERLELVADRGPEPQTMNRRPRDCQRQRPPERRWFAC